jgi:hypothetical protein
MSKKKSYENEDRINLNTTLSTEAFGLLEVESKRENKTIGEILDRLILEGCSYGDSVSPETHSDELETAKKRLEIRFDKIDLV